MTTPVENSTKVNLVFFRNFRNLRLHENCRFLVNCGAHLSLTNTSAINHTSTLHPHTMASKPVNQQQLINRLEEMLKLPENKECADCGTKGTYLDLHFNVVMFVMFITDLPHITSLFTALQI